MKRMPTKFGSIKVRMLLYLLGILGLLFSGIGLYFYIHNKTQNLNAFNYQILETSSDFSENFQNFKEFVLTGYKKNEFYEKGTESSINEYFNNLDLIQNRIENIQKSSIINGIHINRSVDTLYKKLNSLINSSQEFKETTKIRGFKDYGFEGKMSVIVNQLKNHSSLDKVILLQLRRYEKDYLMRGDMIYKDQFQMLLEVALKDKKLNESTIGLLEKYRAQFNELIRLTIELGLINNSGLYAEIETIDKDIEASFREITALTNNRVLELQDNLLIWQLFQTLIVAIAIIFLGFKASKYLTKDLRVLSEDISDYVDSNFQDEILIARKESSIKEVAFLMRNYNLLKDKLAINIKELEKTTAEAKKTAEFKTQFLANMSHEIRSPLNGVIGMLNLLKSQKLSAEQTEYMEIAENSADHLLGLVNMILDQSKLEAGKLKLDNLPLHLKRELKKLARLFEYRALDKIINLDFQFDPKIESYVFADNLRLQQILINLLDNAIKFTKRGEVTLQAKLVSKRDNIQYIKFKVTDTGIGIDLNKTKNLLGAFEQVDDTITRKYGGTGLGLSIANQLVQIMGGKLDIKSERGKGSCFSFEIPFEIDINKSLTPDKGVIYLKVPTEENKCKVLIVEDNLVNQKVMANFLKKLNIECDVAENGLIGLELYKENDYGLILMDLHMPIMDGLSATKEIQSLYEYAEKPIPIIAVTASAFDEDKVNALAHGMHDFITKPVIFNNLQEVIFKHMCNEFQKGTA